MSNSRIKDLFDKKKGRNDRRKALFYTVFLSTLAIVMFTLLGLNYQVPPPAEMGNFVVMGPEVLSEPAIASPQKGEDVPEETKETQPEELQPETPVNEKPAESEVETSTEPEAPKVTKPEPDPKPKQEKPTQETQEKPKRETSPPEKTPETKQETTPPKGTEEGVDEGDDFKFSDVTKSKTKSGKDDGKEDGNLSDGLTYTRKTGFGSVSVVGNGRKPIDIADIDDRSQEDAIVYVKVIINEDGSVFSATVDYSAGTTTASTALTTKAVTSAKNSTYEKGNPGSGKATTVIRYEYKVK